MSVAYDSKLAGDLGVCSAFAQDPFVKRAGSCYRGESLETSTTACTCLAPLEDIDDDLDEDLSDCGDVSVGIFLFDEEVEEGKMEEDEDWLRDDAGSDDSLLPGELKLADLFFIQT
mmetsp:Transcript_8392/g.18328  ORF Transcript_8392/g.18328 Transcript_8392/m.18328 type:complete len:116 (-) Transcript_8392:67-414(-)|eukprot:CAMPEP_0170627766 /NCGR_PEP_ID=MMETSP0224-20130122/32195_1 /TAXON_ID=285029 /ORGANISM="Togula jolla, Strain CCCM 725" /LENGTH=115 /DNA_ID=CAMNT_0010954885 /DNA_START=44 /DNA_END=391 /DNA_ORIENTATION=-